MLTHFSLGFSQSCYNFFRVYFISVMNHHSCMDDPLLPTILPLKTFWSPSTARWTPAADDICFTNRWHALFFALGQVIRLFLSLYHF